MNESKAARYQRRHRRSVVATWTAVTAALALLAVTPVTRILYAMAERVAASLPGEMRQVATSIVFLTMGTVAGGLAVAVVAWRQRTRESGDDPDPAAWRVQLLSVALLVPVVVVAGLVVLTAARLAGGAWWLVATIVLSAILAAVLRVGPRILGAAGAVRPLGRPELAARVADLAARAGVPVTSVGEWRVDEPGATVAMVAGTGRRRQILLAADVVRDWSDDEVMVLAAHELAHLVHGDLLRSLLLNVAVLACGLLASDLTLRGAGAALGVAGAADPRAMPLVALAVLAVWLVATPVRHAQSRHQERRADRFALAITGQAEAFAAAVRRAGARRFVDDRPTRLTSWLFHRHPPIAERLALADRFRQDGAGGE